MQQTIDTLCLVAFIFLMMLPALYGLHMYLLLVLVHRRQRSVRAQQRQTVEAFRSRTAESQWPLVTSQIPLYNELAVAQRVIEAVAQMDYPRGRHEVQVLDDSTDGTRAEVDAVCQRLRRSGYDVRVLRRKVRTHYKAGALAAGLEQARGEYVAIFDADFVPDDGFLRRMIPLIAEDEKAACVQGRWGHLNENESWITEAAALGIDGHFGVEQGARGWNRLLMNFNGTAGIWRKSAILDPRVGGWSGDTITEDLDLSYRAQLAGWKLLYQMDEVCPAEVPANVDALKAQQRRWATGSIQTACKLLPAVWRSSLSWWQKIEASFHLTQYSINVGIIVMALCGRWLLYLTDAEQARAWLTASWWLVLSASLAPSLAHVYARWLLGGRIPGLVAIIKLMLLGLGLSLNNAIAVLSGLWQRGGEFVRTPKSGSQGSRVHRTPYHVMRSRLWLGEIVAGLLCLLQWAVFLEADRYVGGTFLLLFAAGLMWMGWASRPRSPVSATAPAARKPRREIEAAIGAPLVLGADSSRR